MTKCSKEQNGSSLRISYVCRATAPVAGIKRAAGGAPALQFECRKTASDDHEQEHEHDYEEAEERLDKGLAKKGRSQN
jgi:hypothetical protein